MIKFSQIVQDYQDDQDFSKSLALLDAILKHENYHLVSQFKLDGKDNSYIDIESAIFDTIFKCE